MCRLQHEGVMGMSYTLQVLVMMRYSLNKVRGNLAKHLRSVDL